MWSSSPAKSNLSVFSVFTIYFFWIACVFDPIGQIFGLKFVSILCVCIVLLARFLLFDSGIRKVGLYFWTFLLFVVVLPTYGIIVALFRGGLSGEFIDTSYISSAVYFVCSLVYLRGDSLRVGFDALIFCLRLLCLVILLTLVIVVTSVSNGFTDFLLAHGVAFLGAREYSGANFFYIYFVASPMLIFLLSYEAWQLYEHRTAKRAALMLFPVAALFISGTRASIGISLFGILFVWLWRRLGKAPLFLIFLVAAVLISILVFLDFPVVSQMFSVHERSNSVKIGYLDYYGDIFNDPVTFIFGQGYNAQVWSQDFADILTGEASKTELTYLDALRVFGVFVWLALVSCILFLSLSKRTEKSGYPWVGPALLLYICMAALNPYIFSSNGMLLLGIAVVAIEFVSHAARAQYGREDAEACA